MNEFYRVRGQLIDGIWGRMYSEILEQLDTNLFYMDSISFVNALLPRIPIIVAEEFSKYYERFQQITRQTTNILESTLKQTEGELYMLAAHVYLFSDHFTQTSNFKYPQMRIEGDLNINGSFYRFKGRIDYFTMHSDSIQVIEIKSGSDMAYYGIKVWDAAQILVYLYILKHGTNIQLNRGKEKILIEHISNDRINGILRYFPGREIPIHLNPTTEDCLQMILESFIAREKVNICQLCRLYNNYCDCRINNK